MKTQLNILLVLFISFLFSCKSTKQIEAPKLKHLPYKVVLDSLEHSEFDYDWLRSKGTATILFNEDKSVIKTNFRVRKDSAIWNNLSKGPIQISTTLLSQDSVKLIRKVGEKGYFLGSYDFIDKMFDIEMDFKLLQDFISGNPIMFDYEDKYKLEIDSNYYLLSSSKSKKIDKLLKKDKINKKHELLYRCWIDPTNFKCAKIEINMLTSNTNISINYSNWIEIDNQYFPMNSSIYFSTAENTINLDLEYNDNIKVNEPQDFPFKISDNYTLIEFNDEH